MHGNDDFSPGCLVASGRSMAAELIAAALSSSESNGGVRGSWPLATTLPTVSAPSRAVTPAL